MHVSRDAVEDRAGLAARRDAQPSHSGARLAFVAQQAAVVLTMVFVYFRVRGITAGSPGVAVEHAGRVMSLESHTGIGVESELQQAVRDSAVLETLANWVYIWGHWPVIIATMVWLAWRHGPVFLRLRNAMILSGLVGMAVFAAFPVAPPRLAGAGFVDTVAERSTAYRVLQPPAFVNQYAAMPSLHLGWDLLVGIALVTAASSLVVRLIGYLLPPLMALAVIVTANHYVLDAIAGVTLVLVAHALAVAWEHQHAGQASDAEASDVDTVRMPADAGGRAP
jgi:hypothetical protein